MRTCTRCGDTYTVHTHSYTGTTVAPTCTESGYTLYECDCGYSYQGDETAATGHNYTQTVVAPTCTEGGYTQYTCACGHSYQGDETAATGHTYTQTVVAPTCIKTGYTLHQCTCGHSYQSDPTPALGHNYLKTVYPQYIYFYCSRCGDSYTVPIGGLQPIQPKPPIEYMSLDGEETDNAGTDSTERVLVSEVVITYSYVYNGGNLMQETVVTEITTDEGSTVSAETLDYTHGFGGPSALTWRDDTYYYAANLQGDVIAILDDAGNPVVEYTYDAWGNIIAITGPMADTLGTLNPLTYRGYVYDHETGLYYLQSRYYNPEWGRFLNADALVSTGQGLLGNNMFAYCLNNPINWVDKDGKEAERIDLDDSLNDALWPDPDGGMYGGPTASSPSSGSSAGQMSLQTYYPPNNGFVGKTTNITLDTGTYFQRTGDANGRFVAPVGTPPQTLSLPYDKIGQPTTIYQVNQTLKAIAGTAAPWFGQIGGGTQYLLLDGSVAQLLECRMISIY